jgi:hypothetical protein
LPAERIADVEIDHVRHRVKRAGKEIRLTMSKQNLVLFFMMYFVVIAIRLRTRYGIRDRFYDAALFLATLMMFGLGAHIAGLL